jgi:hypothetical protein
VLDGHLRQPCQGAAALCAIEGRCLTRDSRRARRRHAANHRSSQTVPARGTARLPPPHRSLGWRDNQHRQ